MTAPLSASATVLVVDDDDFSQEILCAMLRAHGVTEIQSARNGSQALSLMADQERAHEFLICDIFMPDMDGIEFVGHLATLGYAGGVILVSGGSVEMLAIAKTLAKKNGLKVLAALTKPMPFEALAQAMKGDLLE
jgi:CheY-like chemotaxis protein